ncbi:TolC family outer membrane protein [Aquicoccus sp. SCR17]|nr:TolC family outer membrane protein [Carideicomes alvinocaridis]
MASAYNESGLLEQNRGLLRAADEDVAASMAALRPIINWTGSVSQSFGEQASATTGGVYVSRNSTNATLGISADLLLYDFGASNFATDAAKETVLATRQSLISVEQQVLLRAVRAFMTLRSYSEIVALRQSNMRLITQELRAARDRFEVGEVTRTDVSLAEARLAEAQSQLAAAQGDLAIAQEEYRAAVGHPPGNLVPPSSLPRTAASVEQAKALAVRNHPDLKQVQHQVAAADLAILRAQAAMKPNISLNGQLSVSETFDSVSSSRGGQIGVTASGPIYQGGRLSAALRRAQAQRDATRGGLYVVRDQVQQNAGTAWAQLLVSQAALSSSADQIRAARVAFRGVREEATLGARTTLDVLDAEQELLNAQAGQISAAANEYVAAYSLLASMGLLTADHLNLNVRQYDPTEYYNLVKDGPALSSQGEKLNRVLEALGKK